MKPTIDLEPWTERTLTIQTAHWPGPETCDQLAEALGELPEPVAAILWAAHAQGFRWVNFDADADVCPAFPTFDW